MSNSPLENEDNELRMLLRHSRPAPSLPAGFEDAVWRRLQTEPRTAAGKYAPGWLEALAEWALRPRWAFTGLAVLLITGSLWGAIQGMDIAKQNAQARYLAAVAPYTTR